MLHISQKRYFLLTLNFLLYNTSAYVKENY